MDVLFSIHLRARRGRTRHAGSCTLHITESCGFLLFSPYIMEKAGGHAASLLTSLNLQRDRAEFCDCVVRHRQDPDQLYPAHRCVLAASSPVLASILSSAGVLVELQVSCLSDSVLALVLDYIYTGALPYTQNQQQYFNLLTAACYLHMEDLQEALRTEMNPVDITSSSTEAESQYWDKIDAHVGSAVGESLIQSAACMVEVEKVPFHSAGTVKPESCSGRTEEELVRTAENRRSWCLLHTAGEQEEERKKEDKIHHFPLPHPSTSYFKDNSSRSQCSSTPSPSSPPPCRGAVPVIRHSSTAAIAAASPGPPYQPVSLVSVSSDRASNSQSTGNNRIDEGIMTRHKNHYGTHNQDFRKHVTQSWGFKDNSDKCPMPALHDKSRADQAAILKQDYNSDAEDRDVDGLSHNADDANPNRDGTDYTRGFKSKTKIRADDFPSKRQKMGFSDNISMPTAEEEQSVHSPDHVQASGRGSHSPYDDLCPEEEVKEEHSYSSRFPVEMDRQDSHGSRYSPHNDWYPNVHKVTSNAKDVSVTQPKHNNTESDDVLQHENISDTKVSEPHLTVTPPVDNMSDPMCHIESYSGHLHYHCLHQEDTQLSHGHSDPKPSHPSYAGHSAQSSSEEEAGTCASPGLSPLRQHFAATDQVLLLDISAKPAELLLSYRHTSDEEEKWVDFNQEDTSGNGLGGNGTGRQQGTTSVAAGDRRTRVKYPAKGFDEAETKPWVAPVGEEVRQTTAEVKHEAGGVESENQITTLTFCSTPSVPVSLHAPASSLSVCIPSTLSAGLPTNISAHLSTPVQHPFQCSMCDRSFSQRGSLNRHVRSHLGVRPFPCPHCPMTFSRQYRVIEHMRVHQRCVLGGDFQKPPAV